MITDMPLILIQPDAGIAENTAISIMESVNGVKILVQKKQRTRSHGQENGQRIRQDRTLIHPNGLDTSLTNQGDIKK